MKISIYWQHYLIFAVCMGAVAVLGLIAHMLWQTFGIACFYVPAGISFVSMILWGIFHPEKE